MLRGFRKRFFFVVVSVLLVLVTTSLISIYALTSYHSAKVFDHINDLICSNGGEIPEGADDLEEAADSLGALFMADSITEETPYSTRFFSVNYPNAGGNPIIDLDHIASVDAESALSMASTVLALNAERGWLNGYRFFVCSEHGSPDILFVDGRFESTRDMELTIGLSCIMVFFSIAMLILMIILTNWAAKPVQQAYRRQRRFISNASHELKTPLTLILTDADLIEMDYGPSEEVDDIRKEAREMGELISQMVVLSHLDEEARELRREEVSLSKVAEDAVASWRGTAASRGLHIDGVIQKDVSCVSDAASIKQIMFILMDNATKYCDQGGVIRVDVSRKGRAGAVISVENSYLNAPNVNNSRLFERFYRADAERSEKIGHGIGLALAKETAENIGGSLEAYTLENPSMIGFRLTL